MKQDDIITLPNTHLRKKAERVHVITPEIINIIEQMTEASLDWEKNHPHEISAALAAPQIDKLYKIIIVRSDLDDKNNKEFTALIKAAYLLKVSTEKYLVTQKLGLKLWMFMEMKLELRLMTS